MRLSIIILAAGQGTRMRSAIPKVLHRIGGKPLLEHVIETAAGMGPRSVQVVYGHGGGAVPEALRRHQVVWVEQSVQLGTGHAVAQALPAVGDDQLVLILYGDVPLISGETLARLCALADDNALGLLTAELDGPQGYGRILRGAAGQVTGIVEEKDASELQRALTEINTGFLAAPAHRLKTWIQALDNVNAQGEYYLTDVIGLAVADGVAVRTVSPPDSAEIRGVNNRLQLAELERAYQRREANRLMLAGVTLRDPGRFDLRGRLTAGTDVCIDVDVVLEGEVRLGDRVSIGPGCFIRNAVIGDDVDVQPHCVIEDARVGAAARIGPFARLRPETRLADRVHVGNFVEIKKSDVGAHSKINHLSYIGDTKIGERVNVGAGTITCNYDGASKHKTVIGDDVFIGSDTQLVAPVTVGAGATIGAGSTITRDTPAGELTLSRAPQTTRQGWKRPVKRARREEGEA
jgi:bifunctional UDP-N-acetylglucosamine pyrophosphorylase/glucosamine-1-phosphate N-acetyltransferase